MRKRYRLVNDRLVDVDTGESLIDDSAPYSPVAPYAVSDIPGYRSPIDGSWVEGRRARKYDLEKNGCVESDPPKRKRPYLNKKFADKHGLPFE